MTLNQLISFSTVAQFSSFTEASKHLHIVQSAVSHNVASLEQELHVKLFTRNQHLVSLTKAGAIFLEDSKKILDLVTVAERRISNVSAGLAGSIVIGYCFTFSMLPYQDVIAEFMRLHPDIKVQFHRFHINTIKAELRANVVDIAFIHHIDVRDVESLEWRQLFVERYKLVIWKSHPLAHKKSIHLSELAEENFIMIGRKHSPSHFDNCIRLCNNANFSPRILDEPDSINTIIMMADMEMGVGIIPSSWAGYFYSKNVNYLDVEDPTAFREQGLAWNSNSQHPALVRLFLDFIYSRNDRS